MESKKLYRSSTDRVIAGVCGGIGQYLDVDTTLIRVLFILFSFVGGSGIVLYVLLAIIIPSDAELPKTEPLISDEFAKKTTDTINTAANHIHKHLHKNDYSFSLFFGLIFLFVGILTLANVLFPHYFFFPLGRIFWPLLLILIGLFIIMRRK